MHPARPIAELRRALVTGELSVRELIENALTTAVWRKAQGAKVYLHLDPDAVRSQLDAGVDLTKPLGGLPVSVKDCFDVAGAPSTAGSSFFASTRSLPESDSELAALSRGAGAVLMGKTHLNEFAYGITGENQHFGDCEIPTRPRCLTGGSSSGAAASVVEGSAVIGLGTDTGGSLRAPASFCGLVSFRASIERGEWGGCFPLAQSFDTMGWLCRHLSDMPVVGAALIGAATEEVEPKRTRIGIATGSWLECCDPEIVATQSAYAERLRAAGFLVEDFDASLWQDASALFIPIQAHEAAINHHDFLPRFADRYEPVVRSRLEFGGTITTEAYRGYKARQMEFNAASTALFERFDFLVAPITPVRELRMGEDHSGFRSRILQLTAPASLNGWPSLTVRGAGSGPEDADAHGFGLQVAGPAMADGKLFGLAAALANIGMP